MATRFTELAFRNGKRASNRVLVPPMASQTASLDGHVSEKTRDHYAALAESGVGILMLEYSYVHASGRSEVNQLGIDKDSQIFGLREIAKMIQRTGALSAIQLTHAGGKTSRDLTGGFLMAPSNKAVPVKDRVMQVPDPMQASEITLWQESFLSAAQRARQAGFDIVELHSAHGYGLNQWLSPLTNDRTDEYGGPLENRARLLFEIVAALRKQVPELLLSVRMPGSDFMCGGLSREDSLWIAKKLEELGVDILNVSSGIGGWKRPRDREGEGYLLEEAAAVQAGVGVPVIGVGGIQSGTFIDDVLARGQVSLAAVGRAILKEPRLWKAQQLTKEKNENNRECHKYLF